VRSLDMRHVCCCSQQKGCRLQIPALLPSSAACAGQGTPQYYQTRRPSEPQVGSTICLDKTYLLDTGVCVCVCCACCWAGCCWLYSLQSWHVHCAGGLPHAFQLLTAAIWRGWRMLLGGAVLLGCLV
jgi:hypothetical protein